MKVWRKVKMKVNNIEIGDQINVELSEYGEFTATARGNETGSKLKFRRKYKNA